MGDAQRLSPDEQLRLARERFEQGDDFTVAVEEEFALLDPEHARARQPLRGRAGRGAGHAARAEPRRRADRVRGRGQDRTLRELRATCPRRWPSGARSFGRSRSRSGLALGATGTHPWSPWQEQRIIDTPHYRRNDELLRYVVWRNNTFGLHVHVGIRGADRAVAVTNGLRNVLPELLALSASSPFVENVFTYLHSARTQIFTRFFPRCGVPDAFASWREYEEYVRFLYATGSVDRAHAALVERPAAPRLPDRRDPHLRRAARPRRGAVARRLRRLARRSHRARPRRGRAAAGPAAPPDRGEPLARDPPRPLRRADRLRARRVRPGAGAPRAAARVGAAASRRRSAPRPTSRSPSGTPPSARSPASRRAATLEEIYAEQVGATERVRG